MNKEKQKRPEEEPVAGVETAAVGEDEAVPEETVQEVSADAGQTLETQKPSWEEILDDPDYRRSYDEAVQGIVKARLRGRAMAEERLARLEPVLRALEESYGLSEESDLTALSSLLRESAGLRRPSAADVEAHLMALEAEADVLRESVPDFDLLRELEDPGFLRLTAPHSGVSLADAYYARHRAERERETARRSLEAVSRSVRSLGARPRELRETGAGARFTGDPRQMSKAEREALKKRILEAKAQGKRIEVGG